MKEKEKAAAAASETAIQTVQSGGEIATIDFTQDAGLGLENVRGKDMAIPYLTILQKGSPQVDNLSDKFIDGAKPGVILNTVTGEIYPEIEVIPCGFNHELVEWKPRDSGGGFVGRHNENDPIIRQCNTDDRGRLITPNGNTIIDTKYHFVVLVKPDGAYEWAVISMTSTQLKKSRLWLTTMKRQLMPNGKEYPSFSHSYKLTTVGESKDKYSWYGWNIAVKERLSNPTLYSYAKEFAKAVAVGSVQVSAPPAAEAESTEEAPF